MRKFFLIFLFLFPNNLFAKDVDDFFQEIWANMVENHYDDEYEEIDINAPKFSGRVIVDGGFDNNYDSGNAKDKFNETAFVGRFFSDLAFSKNFSLKSNIFLERVDSAREDEKRKATPDGGGDMAFENSGIYIRELVIDYSEENFSLIAGKFTANFGSAWRWGRGIWSDDLPNNYVQKEKLGFGGIYRIGGLKKTGRYNFGFAAFTNDRKNFNNSIINKRDADVGHKYDAKAGDTRGLNSYNASLDVNFDFGKKEELSYHFAYLNLAVNSNQVAFNSSKIADQKGFVANSKYRYPILENFLLDGLVEYAEMKNIDGNSDAGFKSLSSSLVGEINKNWNLTIANTVYKNSNLTDGNLSYHQNLYEISAGYKFDKTKYFDQFLVQLGYKKLRNNYQTYINEQNALGILLRYIKSF